MAISLNSGLNKNPSSYMRNGIATDIHRVQFPTNTGVSQPPICMMNYIPPTESSAGYLAGSQTIVVGVPMILNQSQIINGGIVYSVPIANQSFNVSTNPFIPTQQQITYGNNIYPCEAIPNQAEQNINLIWDGEAVDFATVTIKGYDARGVAVSENLTINIGNTSVSSNKTYASITSIVWATSPGVDVSVLWGASIGLPYALLNTQQVIYANFGGTAFTEANIQEFIQPAYAWRVTPPTSSTTQTARGKITTFGGTTGNKVLTLMYYVYGADSLLNNQLLNESQSSQLLVSMQFDGNGNAILNQLVPQDLTGVQYPGDLPFINYYSQLLA